MFGFSGTCPDFHLNLFSKQKFEARHRGAFGNKTDPRNGLPRSTPLVIHKNQLSTLILTEQSWRSL